MIEPNTTTGQTNGTDSQYQSKQQIAQRLGVSVRTIESLMAARKIPFIRISRKLVRFPVAEVDAYLRRNLRVAALGE
jgi:excisionase family DNA binding protein